MTSKPKIHVLFVCLGNICRSPAAEAVFQHMVNSRGLADRFVIDSAGTSGYHDGEPADARMIKHGRRRGYELTSISRKLRGKDFQKFDFIVTMDNQNLANARKFIPSENVKSELVLMVQFLQRLQAREIPDPYFGGPEGFERVYDLLEDACEGLLNHLLSR